MALAIEWTAEAKQQLDRLIEYFLNRGSLSELNAFYQKLEKAIEVISINPGQHKQSPRKSNTYEYQLSKQTTIFYTFDQSKVTILLLWQNRMNPEKL